MMLNILRVIFVLCFNSVFAPQLKCEGVSVRTVTISADQVKDGKNKFCEFVRNDEVIGHTEPFELVRDSLEGYTYPRIIIGDSLPADVRFMFAQRKMIKRLVQKGASKPMLLFTINTDFFMIMPISD